MSNKQNNHIYSPAFESLAFKVLKSATVEQKKLLDVDEIKMFKSDATLLRFVSEERMDYVMYILAKIGKSWTFRIESDEYDGEMLEFLTQDQNTYPQKRTDITNRAAEQGVCVISSREVMFYSHMLAQNCTTKIYTVSNLSSALHDKTKPDRKIGKWNGDVAKAQEAHDRFNEILLGQLNSLGYAEESLGLDVYDIRILSVLYKKRDIAMKMAEISEFTRSSGRKMYFRKNLQKLLDEGLVASDAKYVKKMWAGSAYFMITGKGIGKILEYQKFVYKTTFED
jgi:hypothetical protein